MQGNKNRAAAALGRKGGRIGGKAKVPKGFSALTPEQRTESARAAAVARWAKYRAEQQPNH